MKSVILNLFTASLVATLVLAGCVYPEQITAEDGQTAVSVNCSGLVSNWQSCYEKIGEFCGGYGYTVLRSSLDGNIIRGKESSERKILARCNR